MNKTFQTILQIKATVGANTFLYYLKRLWLIGKHIPDRVYMNETLKKFLAVLTTVLGQLMKLIGKVIYLLLAAGLPLMLAVKKGMLEPSQAPSHLVNILFFLSCVMGPMQDSAVFAVTRQKFIALKYMKMPPKRYVYADLFMRYVPFFLYFLPGLIGTFLLAGGSIWQALGSFVMLFSFRFLGEAIQVWYYGKKEIVLSRKVGLVWLLIGLSLLGAYLPILLRVELPTMRILFSIPGIIVMLLIGATSFYYVIWGYKGYETAFLRSVDQKFLLSSMMQESKSSTFADVAVKEEDLEADERGAGRYAHLQGYAYLNALFFARHRRQLVKPVKIRLLIILAVFLGGLLFAFLDPAKAQQAAGQIVTFLPFFVFIMYFMSVGDKACRAMFYNCDMSLLHYGFYRHPKVILKNFRFRLLRVGLYDFVIGLALSAAVALFCAAAGVPWATPDMAMFTATILLLSIFFTVHHLFLYYVFQPFTTELNVKNPFYRILNMAVYILCFICMEIRTGSMGFTLIVLGFTAAYIAVALILVYRFAPKTFRVK